MLRIGYSKKKPEDLSNVRYLSDITRAFQRRFRQDLVDGKIDRECLVISKNLFKIYN